jgi:hypothetical protein
MVKSTYSLSLHLDEMETDTDPAKSCRSDRVRIRIRIHNTASMTVDQLVLSVESSIPVKTIDQRL